ncbi:toxin-antitoxin system HicB family antitoxin [Leuconostoc fallax]|uniref:Toxin-antitoxin system HicB family antitoxin n=1 Tax=Leuconostoc fallax TaxID=1251 RepID=A0A4R5N7W5_9LACO|nr:toxin-antitoxin system HicB family antitoxin [Leuconostoc fallax]MBU7455762.1 toxin-antitoxin system HicB family antitoxin [Leuconostoc fallax]MCO6183962.1 type II toxin-antitoxin system HicB family antitoxin [Leuconostoc fallax]TDG67999.1 hypothetical protein C5L23_000305 [Leuconostoc fallax]
MKDKDTTKSGHIPLRIDPALHEEIARRAALENRSVNNFLQQVIVDGLKPQSFEDRQFVGQAVHGENIDLESRLVKVAGIYYRYLIDNADEAKHDAEYVIIESNGNILTLREIKESN